MVTVELRGTSAIPALDGLLPTDSSQWNVSNGSITSEQSSMMETLTEALLLPVRKRKVEVPDTKSLPAVNGEYSMSLQHSYHIPCELAILYSMYSVCAVLYVLMQCMYVIVVANLGVLKR